MTRVHMTILFVFMFGIAPRIFAQPYIPPFVAKLIVQFESGPARASPGSIWQYRYKGNIVFYVPRLACCDIMSRLYDIHGHLICHPDGGIAGDGDDRCIDFFERRTAGQRIWKDSRISVEVR